MIGICPHCNIKLNKPPFNKRNTNEVILTLEYRNKIDNGLSLKSFDELGCCELCNATKKDKKEQERLEKEIN